MKHIVISKGSELLRVVAERLMYVSSDGNYSHVVTLDGKERLVALQLGQIEDLIDEQLGEAGENFMRIGKGVIINTDYIYYINVAKQQLVLSDCTGSYHEIDTSKKALSTLKVYIETELNKKNE